LGTINGLLRFNTNAGDYAPGARSFPEGEQLHITRLTTECVNQGLQRNYTFPYKQDSGLIIESKTRYFTIGFGGMGDLSKELQFFYRLEKDAGWLPLGNRQEITFVEMPPGNYQLHLRSRLPDGKWTDTSLSVPLWVKPAYYQTSWFKCLIALIVLMILGMLLKYREHILHKEKRLRMNIATDLHDEVGSSLTRIYYQADYLKMQTNEWAEANRRLLQIAETSRQALSTMSDMVWSIDSRFDTMKDLVIRMKDYVYKLQEEVDFQYRFDIRGDYNTLAVTQIVRQNLLLIFKEAITNVMKYGTGSEALIELSFENSFCLSIQNSYVYHGEQLMERQGGCGLQNMKQRAARMHAELRVVDTEGIFQLAVLFT